MKKISTDKRIAKSPKDGLWYAIDRTMMWPVGKGCKYKKDAIKEWCAFERIYKIENSRNHAAGM